MCAICSPDREGETLGRLVPVLQCMLPFCGGEHFTVGVLWDYGSLPQPIRSHAELARHKLGLRAMMMWLAHPYTPVLCMSGSLPTGAEYKNSRPHSQRGVRPLLPFERRAKHNTIIMHRISMNVAD